MNQELSKLIVFGSPFYSKNEVYEAPSDAGLRPSFPHTVTLSVKSIGLSVTALVKALMQTVS